MLVVFLYTNLSPAFCGLTNPEYIVNVEKIDVLDEITQKVSPALMVKAERLVTQTIENTETQVYQNILEKVISPFMLMSECLLQNNLARLSEVLQKVKATVETVKEVQQTADVVNEQNEDELETKKSEEIETDISRGFSLDIEGLGALLISNDGGYCFKC